VKIDLNQYVLDPKGVRIGGAVGADGVMQGGTTLGAALYMVTSQPLPEDQGSDPAEKLALYRLAQKVAGEGEVDLAIEEVARLKVRASKVLTIIAYGAVCDLLEMKPVAVGKAG
jgi:hypothetical protein